MEGETSAGWSLDDHWSFSMDHVSPIGLILFPDSATPMKSHWSLHPSSYSGFRSSTRAPWAFKIWGSLDCEIMPFFTILPSARTFFLAYNQLRRLQIEDGQLFVARPTRGILYMVRLSVWGFRSSIAYNHLAPSPGILDSFWLCFPSYSFSFRSVSFSRQFVLPYPNSKRLC